MTLIESIKLLIRFLPIHSIVLFTATGLLLYYGSKRGKGDKDKKTVSAASAALILWGFIFAAVYGHPVFALLTLALTIAIYAIAGMLLKTKDKKLKKLLLYLGILVSLGTLALFKYPVLKNELPSFMQVKALGISYFTFKFLHVLIDAHRGRIKELDPLSFFAFIFFFPTFSAGPIDRYGRFKKNLSEALGTPLAKEDVDAGITRIITGLFKKFIIADKTGSLIGALAPDILKASRPILWLVLFLYSIRVYYDFSGYSDIAIGLGRLFGFKVPENFNKPYLKPNLVLFWQNWHMTLTSWLREYLFMPLGKLMMGKVGPGHPWLINTVCQLVTMAAVGIWHGSTMSFLIWGLYQGAGLSVYRIYSDMLKKYGSERLLGWMSESKAVYWAGAALTFLFISIGWAFFIYRWDTSVKIIIRLLAAGF